jgi:hypothetical protein
MTNENCLQGLKCPQCGNEDRLLITATIQADVTDGGAEPAEGSDMHWGDDSLTICPMCDRDGPLTDYRTGKAPATIVANRRPLPPDPEGMNDRRAVWAGRAIAAFMAATSTDLEDALPDLLADLIHWCDRKDYDFDLALERGRDHYEAETLGEAL